MVILINGLQFIFLSSKREFHALFYSFVLNRTFNVIETIVYESIAIESVQALYQPLSAMSAASSVSNFPRNPKYDVVRTEGKMLPKRTHISFPSIVNLLSSVYLLFTSTCQVEHFIVIRSEKKVLASIRHENRFPFGFLFIVFICRSECTETKKLKRENMLNYSYIVDSPWKIVVFIALLSPV